MSSAETAIAQLSRGVTTVQLVEILRWRGWPEREGGSDALGPVSVSLRFDVALLSNIWPFRLQSNG